jgi:putative DNA primase/helicase
MTLTLNHIPGTPKTIEKRQPEHTALYMALVPEPLRSQNENTRGVVAPTWRTGQTPDAQTDKQVLEKAFHAANGQRFKRYWEGDTSLWEGQNAERRSKSEADYVLVLYLLTRKQTSRTLFRISIQDTRI